MQEQKKRETAYKIRVGELIRGNKIFETVIGKEVNPNPRLLYVELGNKKLSRVNIIANIVDKYESNNEARFASITVDDGSGQIKARVFGDDLLKFNNLIQGDTILIIGLLRSYNQEMYILPEIVRKQDPKYLLVRKLEIDSLGPKNVRPEDKKEIRAIRDEIIETIKEAEQYDGIDKEEIIMKFKDFKPQTVSQEITKLLEEGIIYEPKPGRVRYLG